MPARVNIADRLGVRISLTPATTAVLQLPALRLRLAMWAPTRELLQAVSMLTLGPDRPKMKDNLPAATLMAEPACRGTGKMI
jgi:hypothetical protein